MGIPNLSSEDIRQLVQLLRSNTRRHTPSVTSHPSDLTVYKSLLTSGTRLQPPDVQC